MQNSVIANNDYTGLVDSTKYAGSQSYNLSFSYKQSSHLSVQSSTHTQSSEFLFQSESVLLSLGKKGHRVFEQAFSIGIRHESKAFFTDSPVGLPGFELPSPADVSNKVLGFIENRLRLEKENDASPEELEKLLAQAREGVEKGFKLARQDIDSLGLLDKELSGEIDDSFGLITAGLNKLDTEYGSSEESLIAASSKSPEASQEQNDKPSTQVENYNLTKTLVTLERFEASVKSEYNDYHNEIKSRSSYGLEYSSYASAGSSFSLETQDGDTVSIRFAETDATYFKAHARANSERYFYQSSQFSGYEISVQGDLDESELLAIQELLGQIGEISDLFFGESFQQAFIAAQHIGFDASEIAKFSLDLSLVQVEEVRVYGNLKPGNSNKALEENRPLVEIANRFDQTITLLNKFQSQQIEFRVLLLESIERETKSQEIAPLVSLDDFSFFADSLLALQVS